MKYSFIKRSLTSSAAAIITVASAAVAGAQTTIPATPPPSNSASSGLGDIIVTARRVNESAQKTPVSITAFSGTSLQYKVIQSAEDIQRETPSLGIVTNAVLPSGLQFSMRGQAQIDTSASTASSVGVYLDDAFLGSASISGGTLDLHDLSRVEVLKGPQGTLYGRNVTAGLVKFVTNKPTDKFEGALTGGVGNYDRRYLEGMINIPISDKVAFRFDGNIDDHGGYSYDVVNRRPLDDQQKYSLRGMLKIEATDRLSILAQASFGKYTNSGSDARTSYIQPGVDIASMNIIAYQASVGKPINGLTLGSLAPLIFGAQGGFTPAQIGAAYGAVAGALPQVQALINQDLNAPRSQGAQNGTIPTNARSRSSNGSIVMAYDLGGATLKSISAYDYGYRDGVFNVGGGPWLPIATDQVSQVKQLTEELQVTGTALNSKLKYSAGAYYLHGKYVDARPGSSIDGAFPFLLGQFGFGLTNETIQRTDLKTDALAFYGQATYAILDNLHFTGGLRWTHEKSQATTFAENLPNLANGEQTQCSAPAPAAADGSTPLADCFGYGKTSVSNVSYTAGGDWEVTNAIMVYAKYSRGFKAGGVNAFVTSGAPILAYKPEINNEAEIGAKTQFFDNKLRLNVDYYHSKYSNIQRVISIAIPGGQSTEVQNAASATIDGVEGELTFQPIRALTLAATTAYTDARYNKYLALNLNYPNGVVDNSNLQFQGIAKWTYSLSGAYDFTTQWSDVHAEVVWAHRGNANLFEADGNPGSGPTGNDFAPLSTTSQPGYGLLNASLTFNLPSHNVTFTFFGKNVLNKRYKESVISILNAAAGYQWTTFGNPATYGVDATIRF